MNLKKQARLKRAKRTRRKIAELGMHRLSVHKTNSHIYAQILSPNGDKVIASASTLEKELKKEKKQKNIATATEVGKLVAQRAINSGVSDVGFDRSGYKYHGQVKALADAAREAGLKF